MLGLIGFPLFAQKNEIGVGVLFLWETKQPFGATLGRNSEYHIGLQPIVSYSMKLSSKTAASISMGTTLFTGTGTNPEIQPVKNTSLMKLRLGAGYVVVNNSKAVLVLGMNAESHLMKRKVTTLLTGITTSNTRVLFGYGGGFTMQFTLKKFLTSPVHYEYQNIGGHHFHSVGITVTAKTF